MTRAQTITLAAAGALPGSMAAAGAVHLLSAVRPLKLDPYVYRIDGALFHFQPSFAMGNLLRMAPALKTAAYWCYVGLPVAMLAIVALYVAKGLPVAPLARSLALCLFAAIPIYVAVPVAGPQYAFSNFPNPPAAVPAARIPIDAPPNGIPSVHFATAILLYLFARRCGRPAQILAWGFALMTFGATLGFGEHYLTDLVLAVPYAALIYRAGKGTRESTRTPAPAAANAPTSLERDAEGQTESTTSTPAPIIGLPARK